MQCGRDCRARGYDGGSCEADGQCHCWQTIQATQPPPVAACEAMQCGRDCRARGYDGGSCEADGQCHCWQTILATQPPPVGCVDADCEKKCTDGGWSSGKCSHGQ